jgi:hypothetical protein
MAFPMKGSKPAGGGAPADDSEAPGGMGGGTPEGPSIDHAHQTIHHHLRAAHGLVKKNPAKAQQHINAAGIAATALHKQACAMGGANDQDGDEPGPGTMNAPGGAYGG